MTYTVNRSTILRKIPEFIVVILRGIGQIMLLESAVAGSLFLAGIFIGSFAMGLAAFISSIVGTSTAILFGFDKSNINRGIYGFSASLVGVALMLFFKPVLFIWILVLLGSALASLVQHFFLLKRISVFTLPFVLVTWLLAFFISTYSPHLQVTEISIAVRSHIDPLFVLKGFGQVIFQSSVISGLSFFIAVLICSPRAALYGLIASAISAFIALSFSASVDVVNSGLFSYNAVLCAIAFSDQKPKNGFWIFPSILIALAIQFIMLRIHLMVLTFPFVAATMITLQIKKMSIKFGKQ